MPGYRAGIELWHHAAELLLKVRSIRRSQRHDLEMSSGYLTSTDYTILTQLYIRFATCLDDLPPHLTLDDIANTEREHNAFATQVADLQVTYNCLRMHIMQRLEGVGYFSFIAEEKHMLLLRKTEVARDMVRVLQTLPFWSLQVNSEPCVSAIHL